MPKSPAIASVGLGFACAITVSPHFPSRVRNQKTTIFQTLTISTALRMLNNPRYAGAYACGRRHYRRTADGKKILRKRELGDWLSCILGAHPGYIDWEQFRQNLKVLEINGPGSDAARTSSPREGSALLQVGAVCGRCGRLEARYVLRSSTHLPWWTELPIDRRPAHPRRNRRTDRC